MITSDIIAIIAIVVSIFSTMLSIFLPNHYANKQKNTENRYNHRAIIFDHILLEEFPVFLSKLLNDLSNNNISSESSINNCNQISDLLIKIKDISIIYYFSEEDKMYQKLSELIMQADDKLIIIPDKRCHNPHEEIQNFKKLIGNIYNIIYNNSVI